MNISLYELSNTYADAFNSFDEIVECAENDEQREELMASWFDTVEGIEGAFEDKAEAVAICIKNLSAEAEAMKAERDRLNARMKAKQNAAERLKRYLLESMEKVNRNKVETARACISLRNNAESVVISDEYKFLKWAIDTDHEDYLRYKDPEINKVALKKALQTADDIPYCELTRTKSVTIK